MTSIAGGRNVMRFKRTWFRALLRRRIAVILPLALGLLDILLAVFFFSRPQHVILILPIVIGFMIMIDSMFKLQMAMDWKRMGLRRWWSMLLLSIISILFSFLLILDPFDGSRTLMTFIGLSLIVDSIQSFCAITYVSKYVRKRNRSM